MTLHSFQIVILAILATHMHLHLWHADRIIHGSDAVVLIPLSNSSASHNIMVAMPGTAPPENPGGSFGS